MNILVIGGTRFFGRHLVKELLRNNHRVTIATRGLAKDDFGASVGRLVIERSDKQSLQQAFRGLEFDAVYDNIAFCSNDVRTLLDCIPSGKYIMTSSTAVYDKRMDLTEADFDPMDTAVTWCYRKDFPYPRVKQEAERALCQCYGQLHSIAVRYPFVIGPDDYTKRLLFYVEHAVNGVSMHIDNLDAQMGFISSHEAGRFLAHLCNTSFQGAVNGASHHTLSLAEILEYIHKKTGKRAVLDRSGEPGPYNGEPAYSINTQTAEGLGFAFENLEDYIYPLLDAYIAQTIST